MLTINSINNTKYKPSFSSKMDYSAIYKEMEKISLTQEEKILPKVNKSTKESLKSIFPKFKKRKANFSFKRIFPIKVTNSRNYNGDRICLKEYADGTYKKYVNDVIKEELLPNGEIHIYVKSRNNKNYLSQIIDSDGIIREYHPQGFLIAERFPDGTENLYSREGTLLRVNHF